MLVNDAKDLLVEPTHGHASQEIVLVIIFKFDTIHHGGDLVQDQLVVAAEQYLELMNNYLKWSEEGRIPTKRSVFNFFFFRKLAVLLGKILGLRQTKKGVKIVGTAGRPFSLKVGANQVAAEGG